MSIYLPKESMNSGILKWEVLNEIRQKLLYIIALFLLGSIIGWFLAYYLIIKIKTQMLPAGVELIALTPLEFVVVQLKISLIFALILVLLVTTYWISKRAKVELKKPSVLMWIVALIVFFVGGVSFAYFVLLPYIVKFLTSAVVETGIEPMYSVDGFMFFTISMMIIFGLVFEFPVITAWLSMAGIVSSKMLSEKRRHAYVGIFIVSAVITPDPSPVSQIMVALPFLFFYEVSVITSKILGKKQQNT